MSAGLIKNIYAIAELRDNKVEPVTYEVASLAGRVANAVKGDFGVLVFGNPVRPLADEIADNAGCDVTGIETEPLSHHHSEYLCSVIPAVTIEARSAYYFIPHTANGWDYAAGLAIKLNASCVSAVDGFEEDSGIVFTRPLCNGKLRETIRPLKGKSAVITVMPGSEKPAKIKSGGQPVINILRRPFVKDRYKIKHVDFINSACFSADLQGAEVIISAGRGIKKAEALALIRELAAQFGRGAVGASRPVCDKGWLDICHQVGMTGQTVRPSLYIACGISGAAQHTAGMKNADLIISINTDKNAPIRQVAHYCVTADLREFIPILIEEIKKFKGRI